MAAPAKATLRFRQRFCPQGQSRADKTLNKNANQVLDMIAAIPGSADIFAHLAVRASHVARAFLSQGA
jgi:hypothetical protein